MLEQDVQDATQTERGLNDVGGILADWRIRGEG